MTIEGIQENGLPVEELYEQYCTFVHDRGTGRTWKFDKFVERLRGFEISELNTMKKIVFNKYYMGAKGEGLGFLKQILKLLEKTVKYTDNYKDLLKKFKERGPSICYDSKFKEILDKLSIPELYQALWGCSTSDDDFTRCVVDKIREKEKKEKEEKERIEEEKYEETRARISSSLKDSPDKVIMMLLQRIDTLEAMLKKMDKDNYERFKGVQKGINDIKKELGINY